MLPLGSRSPFLLCWNWIPGWRQSNATSLPIRQIAACCVPIPSSCWGKPKEKDSSILFQNHRLEEREQAEKFELRFNCGCNITRIEGNQGHYPDVLVSFSTICANSS
jgi:hypothetical protein